MQGRARSGRGRSLRADWEGTGAMHRIFFSVKRVHLRIVEECKPLLHEYDLTPARFDMMRIVMLHAPDGVTQAKIRKLLGVSGATVSRMLKSLEAKGFVRRAPYPLDKRHVIVSITKLGHERVENALEDLVHSGFAEDMARSGVDTDSEGAVPRLRVLQRALSFMRRTYNDDAAFVDPWRTDSLVPFHYTTLLNGRIHYTGDNPQPCVRYGDEYDVMPAM
ncbi:MAG: MarR family transcriptional regulator [Labilithrix sp.]|nr:MarR family transcriptional regulator [Labilithrix sp.]